MTDQTPTGETPTKQEGETPTTTTTTAPDVAMTTEQLRAENEKLAKALKEANKEAAARRKRLDEIEEAEKKRQDAELSEMDKLKKQLTEKDQQLTTMTLATLRTRVAAEVGLPAQFAERLRGMTEEEIKADAKALLEVIPKPQKANPGATNPGGAPTNSEAELRKLVYGRVDPFDPEFVKRTGGGVMDWGARKE